jgi:uncharacterized protein (TIGR02266 family)
MPDERRRAPRARVSGARIKYENAAGELLSALVLDVGRGGVFIRTDKPSPAGKRLALEIDVQGEAVSWAALGRVRWTRAVGEGEERPPGMGIAFIDVDDAVLAAIDRVVSARASVGPGPAGPPGGAPPRERTMLGVGLPTQPPAPTAPILAATAPPAREKTELGIAPQPIAEADAPEVATARPADERSVAIDLVAKKPRSVPPAHEPAREISLVPAGLPKRTGAGWLLLIVLLASAGGAGYAFRDRLRPWVVPYLQKVMRLASAHGRTPPDNRP